MRLLILLLGLSASIIGFTQPIISLDALTTPLCNSSADGEIYISVSGGVLPYTYDWDIDGTGDFDDPEDLINVMGGVYTCIVLDNNGDSDTLIMNLPEPFPIDPFLLGLTPSCCGADNGSFSVTCPSGTGPYFYSIDGGITSNPTGTFDDLFAGNYCVLVTDSNGCVDSICVPLPDEPMNVSTTVTGVTCIGGSDGTAALNITGGCGNIFVDWDYNGFGDLDDTVFATGLPAGTYFATVTDEGDCIGIAMAEIVDGMDEVVAVLDSTVTPDCNYSTNGAIYISITTGIGPVAYDWDNDGTGDFNDSEDLINVPGGTYELVVEDLQGCIDTLVVDLQAPSNFTYNYISNTPTCCGANDGSFELEAQGGVGPYTYSIDGFLTSLPTGHFENLFSGLYEFLVQDSNGCIDTTFQALSDQTMMVWVTPNDPSCIGGTDGGATVSVSGGCGSTSIDWDYNGWGDTNDPAVVTGLAPGTYWVQVENDGLCSILEQVTIGIGGGVDSVNVYIDSVNTNICNSTNEGAIYITASGTPPYTYDWDNDGTGDNDDLEDLDNLYPGTYTLIVTDDLGCMDTVQQEILEDSEMAGATVDDVNICLGDSIAAIYPFTLTGTPPFLYDWDIDGLGDLDDAADLTNIPAGNYTLIVQDSTGCQDTLDFVISDGSPFDATASAFADSLIADQMGTYQWVECPSYTEVSGEIDYYFNATQNGLFAVIIQNSDGCIDTTDCLLVEGIGWQESSAEFMLSPNPANEWLKVQLLNPGGDLYLYNVRGQLIYTEKVEASSIQLDLELYPNGVYFIEHTGVRKKLVIQH